MAHYKVPQDVEADDKLLGPFSFRQFVYLMVAAGLCFVAFLLFQIFPLLVIIPIPVIIFLGLLALPLKKDQPMETYLSAVVDFYMKPQKRIWMPGQSDTAITITAPKNVEDNRTKNISQEEAGRRLSFLANIVDTEGYAIKETNSNLRDDIASEAAEARDIFEANQNYTLDHSLEQSTENRRAQLVQQMRAAIDNNTLANQAPQPTAPAPVAQQPTQPAPAPVAPVTPVVPTTPIAQPQVAQPFTPAISIPSAQPTPATPQIPQFQAPATPKDIPAAPVDVANNAATIQPDLSEIHQALAEPETQEPADAPNPAPAPEQPEAPRPEPNADLKNLAHNSDYSVATIAKQAKRIKEQSNDNEVYISLH